MANLLEVVEKAATKIQESSLVYAMWLEGSWATGKNNEHSDIFWKRLFLKKE